MGVVVEEGNSGTMPSAETGKLGESSVMHAMSIDDAYRVEKVLARGVAGVTELVTIDGSGPFVRKKIACDQARRGVWAAVADCRSKLLPHIRATYEMPEWFVVVYDFVPGETLEHRVAREGALSVDGSVRMAKDVCAAVGELHGYGVIHRDLSPANIVLSSDGAHVIDLGIARMLADRSPGVSTPYGTVGFASPEQYGFDGVKTDVRSDVYSIGRLLDFALTGVRSEDERHAALLHDAAMVPPRLREVIEHACAFEPSARYQTTAQLSAAIADAVGGGVTVGGAAAGGARSAAAGSGRVSSTDGAQDAFAEPGRASASNGSAGRRRRVSSRRRIVIAACAVVAVVVIAAGAFAAWRFSPAATDGGAQSGSASPSSGSPTLLAKSDAGSAAGGSSQAASAGAAAEDEVELELLESGWSVTDSGYILYGFALRNPSSDLYVDYPQVTITGRAEDGSIVFSELQTLYRLAPGETQYFGFTAGNGTAPASVEFAAVKPEEWYVGVNAEDPAEFVATAVNEVPNGIGGVDFTGEVRKVSGDDGSTATGLAVTLIFRDAEGDIVFGNTTFPNKPSGDEAVPFSISVYDPPSYATVEAHATYW